MDIEEEIQAFASEIEDLEIIARPKCGDCGIWMVDFSADDAIEPYWVCSKCLAPSAEYDDDTPESAWAHGRPWQRVP